MGTDYGLAYVDVTTGEFCAAEVSDADLAIELARLDPAEVLLPDGARPAGAVDRYRVANRRAPVPTPMRPSSCLREHFHVASLEGYGLRGQRLAMAAAGAVLAYLGDNQRAALANVTDLEVYNPSRFLVLDAAARRHLELFQSLREGSRKGSLLDAIDVTRTAMGSRLLARWLGQPLLDVAAIKARLDRVAAFCGRRHAAYDHPRTPRETCRTSSASSVVSWPAPAAPRDLAALRRALDALPGATRSV